MQSNDFYRIAPHLFFLPHRTSTTTTSTNQKEITERPEENCNTGHNIENMAQHTCKILALLLL